MAQLIGIARLGRDAETRHTPQGDAVTELSLAFSYGKKDHDSKRPTQWAKGSIWGQRGESLCPHLKKGTSVYVILDDAHIQTFQKQDGTQGTALVGKVSTIEFAGRPADSGGQQPQHQAPPPQQQAPARQPAQSIADMDSDIPF